MVTHERDLVQRYNRKFINRTTSYSIRNISFRKGSIRNFWYWRQV